MSPLNSQLDHQGVYPISQDGSWGNSYAECTKSWQDNWIEKKKALPPALWYLIGVGTEEGRHMCHESQNGIVGSAEPKRPVSLAWGKKRLVGRWTHPKHSKVWEVV